MTTATMIKPEFKDAMEAMRAHHLSRTGGDFFAKHPHFQPLLVTNSVQSGMVSFLKTDADVQTVDDGMQEMKATLGNQQQAVADDSTTGATDAANSLKTSKDVDDFKHKMDLKKQKALQDSDTNISAAFDKATALGVAHPESQSAVLAGMDMVQNVIGTFTSLLSDMVSKVVSLVEDILKEIMENFNGVIKGFESKAGELLFGLL